MTKRPTPTPAHRQHRPQAQGRRRGALIDRASHGAAATSHRAGAAAKRSKTIESNTTTTTTTTPLRSLDADDATIVWLTPEEAAAHYKVSVRTIYRWVNSDDPIVRYRRFGRTVRIGLVPTSTTTAEVTATETA